MGLLAQITSPSPHLGRQGITNASHQERPVRLPPGPYPQSQPPGQPRQRSTSQDTSSLGSRYQSQIIPTSSGNTRFSDAYGGTITSTRVSSGPRPTTPSEINRIVMGRHLEHHLHDPRGLPSGPSRPETPSSPLHLDLKDWDILKCHRALVSPITRAGNRHLRFRMDRVFLGCHNEWSIGIADLNLQPNEHRKG
jgi:hypothetical protein